MKSHRYSPLGPFIRASLLLLFLAPSSQAVMPGPCPDQWAKNGRTVLSQSAITFTTVTGSQASSAWNPTPLNLNSPFDMSCSLMLQTDGVAFVIQSQGLTALGGWGAGQGYGNVYGTTPGPAVSPSVDFEVDTWSNPGSDVNDPSYDHLSVKLNGVMANYAAGPVYAIPGQSDITDGRLHAFRVTWDPSVHLFNIYFDGSLRLTYTADVVQSVFGGSPDVYWGFTGSSASATQYVVLSCGPTPSPTFTVTPSFSPSSTPTSSPTPTPSITFTPTPSFTPSPTPTSSPTSTWTDTLTPTASPSSTFTSTPTLTPTCSPTPTFTSTTTFTLTYTSTFTPTPAGTPTVTPTPTSTPPDIFYVSRNLYHPGQDQPDVFVRIRLSLPGHCSVKIYNSAGELIRDLWDQAVTGWVNQDLYWDGTNRSGAPVASGVYLVYYTNRATTRSAKLLLVR